MATKSFNDICVEYAHQLGKGLPLTAPEMCNAVIMYLNAQITEMQGITTALQIAVTEVEESATEATNTANELSGKVDNLQTNVTEAESNATEALNKANDISETVNALPKVPTPTVTDNGKVIGVQNGAYALVEQRGGEAPANMVTTDTSQNIVGNKTYTASTSTMFMGKIIIGGDFYYKGYNYTFGGSGGELALKNDIPSYTEFSGVTYTQGEGAEISYGDNKINLPIIAGDNVIIGADDINRHIKISSVIPDNVVTYNEDGYVYLMATGNNADVLTINAEAIHDSTLVLSPKYLKYIGSNYAMQLVYSHTTNGDFETILPSKSGTIALLDDIPDLDNYTGTIHIVQGTAGSGIAVHDTVNASPYTKYGYDKIETYGNSNALQYTLNIPNKNGTIATLDDIGSTSVSKYFTRVIFHNTDEDTQYILFSCITNTDLSSNTSYANVISLLTELGATTAETALPCSGKTVTGGMVVGIYTDGTNIIVFDTDNTTEELTMTSEIKFISK